jgi:hypothetical protein
MMSALDQEPLYLNQSLLFPCLNCKVHICDVVYIPRPGPSGVLSPDLQLCSRPGQQENGDPAPPRAPSQYTSEYIESFHQKAAGGYITYGVMRGQEFHYRCEVFLEATLEAFFLKVIIIL